MVVLYLRVWPCFINWVNYADIVSFIMILFSSIGALCIEFTGNAYVGIAVFLVGVLGTIVTAVYLYRR